MRDISHTDDVIDSRDVIERIEELQGLALEDRQGDDGLDEDEREELKVLLDLASEGENSAADWQFGAALIHDAYFEEYARQLADDIGAIDADAGVAHVVHRLGGRSRSAQDRLLLRRVRRRDVLGAVMSGKVEPMTFHAPGWSVTEKIDGKKIEYQVWAPGAITHQGRPTDKTRDFWQGAWTGRSGYTGDVRRGDSLEDALAIFPRSVADKFRKVVPS